MRLRKIALFLLLLAFSLNVATARTVRAGSSLSHRPNLAIGANLAPILDPITGAPTLAPTGQTSCTMRFVGYIGVLNRAGSIVPSNGVITKVRVRSGSNPAPLRVVIMSGSAGRYGTVVRSSRIFRPRANAVTTVTVNLRVQRTVSGGQRITDAVALSAVGPGTLPFFDSGTAGTFRNRTGITQLWYPQCRRGDPRVEGYAADGLELLLQWDFVPSNRPIN